MYAYIKAVPSLDRALSRWLFAILRGREPSSIHTRQHVHTSALVRTPHLTHNRHVSNTVPLPAAAAEGAARRRRGSYIITSSERCGRRRGIRRSVLFIPEAVVCRFETSLATNCGPRFIMGLGKLPKFR